LDKSVISGEVFVWHDILYEGPREPGWPSDDTLNLRAGFLKETTGGGLSRSYVLETLKLQYAKLKRAQSYGRIVLWFDACLFDQAMLCHILACMHLQVLEAVDLICVDAYPGIKPFNGLGQLSPEQFALVYNRRRTVKKNQFVFAERVDNAFALQDRDAFNELALCPNASLPWVPAAVKRWNEEQPDRKTGLGLLERMALEAIRSGCETSAEIFSFVSAKDTSPQFWGDITLWAKINALADRQSPLIRIEGPQARLPQWEGIADLKLFRVYPVQLNASIA